MDPKDVPTAPRVDTLDARLRPVIAALVDPRVRVMSFDVFDTLLWRRVPEPVDAFVLLALRLHERGLLPARVSPPVFRRLRIAAEQQARDERLTLDGKVEVTLPEIYAALAKTFIFGRDPELESRIAAEVELELELLVPDLDVAALAEAAREQGKQVIAVSDTYFAQRDVERFLATRGVEVDRVFVSSSYGWGKGSGLWGDVLEALGVEADAVVHLGDNEHADVHAPRDLGVRSFLFERRDAGLNEILEREARLEDPRDVGPGGDFGLTALRTKVLYRRECDDLPPELREFWRYGAASIGPALAGFAEWVQERTRVAGASRALCFMREGALLAELVEAAGAPFDAPVSAEPLWLSRQTLARGSIYQATRDELEKLLTRRTSPTVRELCATLDLDVQRIPAVAGRADASLSDVALRNELFDTVHSDPELRAQVLDVSSRARKRVTRYMEGFILPGEETLVLVDLGWQATAQGLLNRILSTEDFPRRTTGLYLLTHAGAVDRQLAGADVQGYLAESGDPEAAVRAIIRSPEILEQVCMPDHGSQVDLSAEMTPVLAEQAPENALQAAERRAVQQGFRAFQREWVRYRTLVPDVSPSLAGAEDLLRAQLARAVASPTAREAQIFSAWLHDENFGSSSADAIAGSGLVPALRHMDPQTLIGLSMADLYWPFGLAALHDEHLARAAELVALDVLPWDAFGSALETGEVHVTYDGGWGFTDGSRRVVPGRRNRFGLSFVQATVGGDDVRAMRLYPVRAPALIRIDFVELRGLRRGDGALRSARLSTPQELAGIAVHELHWVTPKVIQVAGGSSYLELDVRKLLGAELYEATLTCAFAALPTPPPSAASRELDRRVLEARRRVRRFELRTGLPFTQAVRKARGLARRLRG
jgi:FMN phosphatase YigB (HAD superfamily)